MIPILHYLAEGNCYGSDVIATFALPDENSTELHLPNQNRHNLPGSYYLLLFCIAPIILYLFNRCPVLGNDSAAVTEPVRLCPRCQTEQMVLKKTKDGR